PEAMTAVHSYLQRKSAKNETVYAISDLHEVLKIIPGILTQGPERRKRKNISSKIFYSGEEVLSNDRASRRQAIKLKDKAKGDLNIYNDRMTILSYKGDESTGVIIESKEIVAVIRQLFELAWKNQSKK
ncbi:MAG: hypothetical protein ACKO96_18335, partial [Flammeovirgaceae bacterium]